jgi:Na+-driven multidrug efflux pump
MGDTFFLLLITGIIPVVFMIIPTYLLIEAYPHTLVPIWINMIIYVIILALIYSIRFKVGNWRNIKVI